MQSGCFGAITRGSGAAARPAEPRLARAADGSSTGPQRGARVGPEYRDRRPRPDARGGRVAVGKAQHPLRLPQIRDRRMARAAAQVRPRPACLFPATPAGCQRRRGGVRPSAVLAWPGRVVANLASAASSASPSRHGHGRAAADWIGMGTGETDRPGRRQRPAGAGRIPGPAPRNRRPELPKPDSPLPKSDIDHAERPGPYSAARPLTCGFSGVSEGIRTPDTQDHNLVL